MWIARDKDGELNLYYNKPHKIEGCDGVYWADGGSIGFLPAYLAPEIHWTNSPKKVKVIIEVER